MSCNAMDLSAYADGELPPDRAAAVRAHCDACAGCAAELADLAALTAALVAEPTPPVRAAAVERAVEAARAAVRRPSVWRTLARFWGARVAVPAPALALGLAAALLLGTRSELPMQAKQVRVTVMPAARPAARVAVYEEWRDAGELWEQPARPARYEPQVIYHESVRL